MNQHIVKRRAVSEKLAAYFQLMRLHRPIVFLLLLCPTLWALWIAGNGMPDVKVTLIFIAGAIVMRSAGDVINDIADRHFDGHVARTKNRPLAAGKVTVCEALVIFFILCSLGLLLVLQLNSKTIIVASVALVLAAIYPFAKRVTHFPQVVLGLAWNLGILMAFTALQNQIPVVAWILYLAAICWTVAFDTMYAMADREEDLKIGIKSTAIYFGKNDIMAITIFQMLTLTLLILVGLWLLLPIIYYLGLLAATGFTGYQHYLLRQRDPQRCVQAFFNNSWFGVMVFCGLFFALGGY